MDKVAHYWWLFAGLAVLCSIAFVIMYWGEPYTDHKVLDTFICNAYAWFGTLGVYLLVTVAGFAGAFILDKIIRCIPFLRWCILGSSRKGMKKHL